MLNDTEAHHAWCVAQLQTYQKQGPPIVITDIVYAEFSVGMGTQAEVDEALATLAFDRIPSNDAALFRAGKAFKAYRDANRGRAKDRLLPDFLVGAAADVCGSPLVTTNAKDFKTYFPNLQIVEPLPPASGKTAPTKGGATTP